MKAAADGLVLFLLTVVLVWTLVFGISAAVVARQRGRNGPAWCAVGALTGPFALGYLWWDSRRTPPADVPEITMTQTPTQTPSPTEPAGGSSYFDL